MKTINGKFKVKATALELDEASRRVGAMKNMFEKSFEGPLTAEGTVSMLGLMNKELGSGAYVALEKIEGIVDGKSGSFCLTHVASMTRGKPELLIKVVPDSGTGELVGISGTMEIDIKDGDHFYTFKYSLDL